MDKQALLELADKVQALEGPSREIDCRVWSALDGLFDFDLLRKVVPDFNEWRALYYTLSIDAAMALGDGLSEAQIWNIWNEALTNCALAKADTRRDLARYWTAAALRAKAGEIE